MPLNYAGPHGMLAYDSMSLRFFHKLGASSSFAAPCAARCGAKPGPEPMAAVPASGPKRPPHAKLNVVWGNNATVTNLHLVRNIHASRRRGGRLVVVDPLRTKIAEQADLHLTPTAQHRRAAGFCARRRAGAARRPRRAISSRDM